MRILDFLVYAELNLYFSMFNGVVDGWLTRIEIVEVGAIDSLGLRDAERRGEERRGELNPWIELKIRAEPGFVYLPALLSWLSWISLNVIGRQTDRYM